MKKLVQGSEGAAEKQRGAVDIGIEAAGVPEIGEMIGGVVRFHGPSPEIGIILGGTPVLRGKRTGTADLEGVFHFVYVIPHFQQLSHGWKVTGLTIGETVLGSRAQGTFLYLHHAPDEDPGVFLSVIVELCLAHGVVRQGVQGVNQSFG